MISYCSLLFLLVPYYCFLFPLMPSYFFLLFLFIPDASREPPRCSGPHHLCGSLWESRTQFHVDRHELKYREALISMELCLSWRGDRYIPQEHVYACNGGMRSIRSPEFVQHVAKIANMRKLRDFVTCSEWSREAPE